MAKRKGAIIPDPVNPSGTYRRVLCIPGSPDWIALVTGALYVLTQAWYWDAQTGDVDAVVERAKQMYFEYQDQSGDCDPVTEIVGEIRMMANATLPDGWLYCNGDEVAKATYPELWDAITDAWGTATNPTDNFLLPDLRNRFPLGFAQGGGSPAFASLGGEAAHTLTTAEMPSHAHDTVANNLWQITTTGGAGVAPSGAGTTLDINTGNTGGGGAHNNMPPYAAISFIIYAGV
jgi:microcystin-dependent protein